MQMTFLQNCTHHSSTSPQAATRRYAVGCAETATQLRRLAGRAMRPVAACVLRTAFRFLRRGHRRAFVRHW